MKRVKVMKTPQKLPKLHTFLFQNNTQIAAGPAPQAPKIPCCGGGGLLSMPLSRPRLHELEQELLALETARKTEKEREKERARAHEWRRQERSITSEVLSYLLY
jgi:hypothetical protein